jgi:hypothetical protein
MCEFHTEARLLNSLSELHSHTAAACGAANCSDEAMPDAGACLLLAKIF